MESNGLWSASAEREWSPKEDAAFSDSVAGPFLVWGDDAQVRLQLLLAWGKRAGSAHRFCGPCRRWQGYHVKSPKQSSWWHHDVELHFVAQSTSANTPGEGHVLKLSYSRT